MIAPPSRPIGILQAQKHFCLRDFRSLYVVYKICLEGVGNILPASLQQTQVQRAHLLTCPWEVQGAHLAKVIRESHVQIYRCLVPWHHLPNKRRSDLMPTTRTMVAKEEDNDNGNDNGDNQEDEK